jgi:hypothetical protein
VRADPLVGVRTPRTQAKTVVIQVASEARTH